jgi:hypothetical protein
MFYINILLFQWYLNDKLIENPVLDEETGGLALDNINETNRGIYKCVALNPIGMDERTIMVTVHVAPVIDVSGTARTRNAIVNETITLECPANSYPPPERRWYFEGTQIHTRSMNDMVSVSIKSFSTLTYLERLPYT